ncbi:MAG TPA: GerMN domain-containing protein [Candidatus Acidoferrum sp.]|nr:GerMN domain-containing protein [Candidatus Acidoferrum sp.]
MTPRWKFLFAGGLVFILLVALIFVPILRRRMKRAAKLQQQSEEQARRELTQPITINPGDPRIKTELFWASDTIDATLVPVTVELPLASDPVLRSKQILNTLLAGPVDAELRTLPPDALLLAFYLLPDGTAIADFSEALATSVPSGIASEQLAVNSIARTLEANVPQVQRLKILIHGQEVETLAGHLDLTGTFVVNTRSQNGGIRAGQVDLDRFAAGNPAKSAADKTTAPLPER